MAAKQATHKTISGFRYYGGKFNMIKHIMPLIPTHRSYIEPFCGGGAVLMNKEPCYVEIVNDLDSSLMHLYYVVKSDVLAICELLEKIPYSESFFCYAKDFLSDVDSDYMKERVTTLSDVTKYDIEIACYRLFVNICSFLALNESFYFSCKANSMRCVSYYLSLQDRIINIANRLKNVTLVNKDAISLLKMQQHKDAFIYLDPPYVGTHMGSNKEYQCYDKEQMDKLIDWCLTTEHRFLLSNYANILELYPELNSFNRKFISQKIRILNTQNINKTKTEVLIYNYDEPKSELF